MNYILAVISGFLMFLCFPENNLFWLTWIALVPLFMALMLSKRWWQAIIIGCVTGFIYFGGVLFWLKIVGLWVGKLYGILAYLTLVVFQGLYVVLFALLFYLLFNWIRGTFKKEQVEYYLFALAPALWIACEWLRAQGPFGVSVGALAYTQYQVLPVIQITSIFGTYGLSFIIILTNYTLARFFYFVVFESEEIPWRSCLKMLGITLAILGLMTFFGIYQLKKPVNYIDTKKISTAIFQPNIPQENKLDMKYYEDLKDMYIQETKRMAKLQKTDLFLWPETILPMFNLRDRYFIFRIKEAARSHVLFGTPTLINNNIYNSMVLLNGQGREVALYNKQLIVPFGEYLPFKKLLYPFLAGTNFFENDYSRGEKNQSFQTPWGKFACGICFESILPQIIRPQIKNGGQLIVIITNDAWFKRTAALELHLAMSVMRAVENRRYLIQVANTGYSFVADPFGRIIKKSTMEKQQWLTTEVLLKKNLSIYSRWGDILVYISLLFILFMLYQWSNYRLKLAKYNKLEKLRKEMQ